VREARGCEVRVKLGGFTLLRPNTAAMSCFFVLECEMFPEMFIKWIESQRELLEARGFHVESVVPNLDWDNSGRFHTVILNFELPKYFGDVIVWRSGECDIDLVDVDINVVSDVSKLQSLVLTSDGEHPFPGDWRRLILIQKAEDFAKIYDEFLEPLLNGEPI
jgi:hypothetical protein